MFDFLQFIDEIGYHNINNTARLMEILEASPAKFFVCERTTDKSYQILEITHEPVAYQLLERFFNISTSTAGLYEKFKNLLVEPLMEIRFLKQELHSDIREVLGERSLPFQFTQTLISSCLN